MWAVGVRGMGGWAWLTSFLAALLVGCAVYPAETTPSLARTTSAEQVDRIFWKDVAAGKWIAVNALLAPNTVWRVGDEVIPRAEIVPWLKKVKIHAVQVSDVVLTPAVNDMNIVSTVQVQAEHAVSAAGASSGDCSRTTQTLHALAVWQQPQPALTPAGAAVQARSGQAYLLTVQDLSVAGDAGCH